MRREDTRIAMGKASDSRTGAARGSNAAPMQGGPRVAGVSWRACRRSQAAEGEGYTF